MGWNSWNRFACDISEDLIKETADALVSSGLSKLGYNYVNLDDCWHATERDADGNLVADPKRFPSGMKALGDYIHAKGLKFGIYSSAGFKTCQAFPASLGMEDLDAAKYAEWGADYLKYDNCYQDHGAPQVRYPPMAKALQNSGRDILYSLCEWGRENPATWAPEISHSWRISGDIKDEWRSIVSRANIAAPLWRYAGPGGWNDPDMLEVGNGGCSMEEYKSHFSLWAMLKAPLIIGNDIRGLTAEDEAMKILMNDEIVAINQDPLGVQARRVYSDALDHLASRGDRLIATKCVRAADAASPRSDKPIDQQWVVTQEGLIKSTSTGRCLTELNDLSPLNATDADVDIGKGAFGVGTSDCAEASTWDVDNGNFVSRRTGRCLEVSSMLYPTVAQGKRIQTGVCQSVEVKKEQTIDIREHQSWTTAHGQLLNLYQVGHVSMCI
jgi:alpha-galactosidase